MNKNRIKEFLFQFSSFLGRNNRKTSQKMRSLLEQIIENPINAHAQLKVAEIYQKNGEKQKALAQYLKAAGIFCDTEQYPKALAIYTKVLKENPQHEMVKLKLADICNKMGFFAQAFAQYHSLFCSYILAGVEDKALEMLGIMADMDPDKFTLDEKNNLGPWDLEKAKGQKTNKEATEIARDGPPEKEKESYFDLATILEPENPVESDKFKLITLEESHGFERIYDELNQTRGVEKIYNNYNYQMGLVCKEMGLIDEAIKQFKAALEKKQKPIEAGILLDQCLKDRRCREEARNPSGRWLQE